MITLYRASSPNRITPILSSLSLLSNNVVSTQTKTKSTLTHQKPSSQVHKPLHKTFTSINTTTPYQICFLRHGQSTWNRDNRFIGWTDTPLTEDGVLEARVAGQMLAKSGMLFDEVHTSLLRRSIRTTNLVLMEMGQEYIPVYKHWRLNERNYGDLVGKNKKEVVKAHGADQVKRWRRSFDEPPPPMKSSHEYWPGRDPRYRSVSPFLHFLSISIFHVQHVLINNLFHDGSALKQMIEKIPKAESLCDTIERSSKYWDDVIIPALDNGKTLLIVGHENNLRSLIMRLEGISKEDIINLSLPRAVPLAYRLDPQTWKPLSRPYGKLDEATGFLRGEWIGGDTAVKQILNRDDKQVYDTKVSENLELGETRDKWKTWMEFAIGQPEPEMKAKSAGSEICGGDNVQQMTPLSKKAV